MSLPWLASSLYCSRSPATQTSRTNLASRIGFISTTIGSLAYQIIGTSGANKWARSNSPLHCWILVKFGPRDGSFLTAWSLCMEQIWDTVFSTAPEQSIRWYKTRRRLSLTPPIVVKEDRKKSFLFGVDPALAPPCRVLFSSYGSSIYVDWRLSRTEACNTYLTREIIGPRSKFSVWNRACSAFEWRRLRFICSFGFWLLQCGSFVMPKSALVWSITGLVGQGNRWGW